jgi:hypothetical protein
MPKASDLLPINIDFLKDLAEEEDQDVIGLAKEHGMKDPKTVEPYQLFSLKDYLT